MKSGFEIHKIQPGSPAHRTGIRAGERLVKINGYAFHDILDYFYLSAGERVILELQSASGKTRKVPLNKRYDEEPGLEFAIPTIGPLLRCRNRCVFCFIDQQPPGLRPSLYEKDDDYRLSFFHGNYITLSNLGPKDLRRIIRKKVSPLYISIHATDPQVRCGMMNNPAAGRIMEQLKELAAGGIQVHGQVVVCPGHNDGAVLWNTVEELSALYPALKTLALVPVGLTGHRRGLAELSPVNTSGAREVVEYCGGFQQRMLARAGTPFVYLADEFYLLAGAPIPPHEHYGAYEQLENGVGLSRLFLNEMEEWAQDGLPDRISPQELSIATGRSAEFLLRRLADELREAAGLRVHLYALPNRFWGGNVTVSGLLTGSDLIAGLHGRKLGQMVLISRDMLKEGTRLFLDGLTLEEVSGAVGAEVIPIGSLQELKGILQRTGRSDNRMQGKKKGSRSA